MIIYKCTNKINGKVYIGQTNDFEKRKKQHIKSKHMSIFHKSIKKYGEDNFEWEIIENCNDRNELNDKEIFYIDLYNSFENGYNMTKGGDGHSGCLHNEETKLKMSKSGKGRIVSDETKLKMSKYRTGKIMSEEQKKLISQVKTGVSNKNKGKKLSEEHIKKISKSLIGKIPWNKGLNKENDERVKNYGLKQKITKNKENFI